MKLVLVAIVIMLSPMAAPPAVWWSPESGHMFDIRLQTAEGETHPGVQVIELDVHDATPEQVQQLEAGGIRTICYFSVGTWEAWRPDANAFPQQVRGNAWDEWPGERYLDTRAVDALMPIYKQRLDLCRDKGFSGVDPDNIDSWWADTGFPLTQGDNERLISRLIEESHHRGLAIGQKNAPDLSLKWSGQFDFAVTEDCAADRWCDDMQPYLDAGKPVYAIEYTDRSSAAAFQTMCGTRREGFSLVLKHRDLDSWAVWCK